MAKDRTNSEPDDPAPDESSANEPLGSGNHQGDANSAREARLAAIKAAVDAGKYDSDEMLEIALKKMIQRLPLDHDE